MKKFTKEISAMLAALTATGSVAGYADSDKVSYAAENGYEVTTCEASESYPLGGVTVVTTAGTYSFTDNEEYPEVGDRVTDLPYESFPMPVPTEELYPTIGDVLPEETTFTTTEEYPTIGDVLPEETTFTTTEEYPVMGNMLPEEEYPTAGVPLVTSMPEEEYPEVGTIVTEVTEEIALGVYMPPPGDVNKDGHCDLTDLSMLSLELLGEIEFDEYTKMRADINHDGTLDLRDLGQLKISIIRFWS
ncbi:MAG: hypothetical protein E7505_07490 [Ruminococcus sp.]|nr:hypothetical protein [Ruminococcus sp.]